MRIAADNQEEYKQLTTLQNLMTQRFKAEQQNDPDGPLTLALKKFINTPLEKSWELPGTGVQVANNAVMDTEDPALFIPYIVHAAINKKKLAIEYASVNKPVSKRIIEPMNWSPSKNGVNVVAWCHEAGAWRHFNPKSMLRVAVTDLAYDRPEDVTITAEDAREMALKMI